MATITIKFKDGFDLSNNVDISINFGCDGIYYQRIQVSNDLLRYQDISGDWFTCCNEIGWTNYKYKIITLDTNQTNFNAFITAMKDNIEGVLLESGTYVWVDVPNLETGVMDVNISFTSNNAIWNYIHTKKGVIAYTVNAEWSGVLEYGWDTVSWKNDAYKTITTTTDQYVDYDFYNYAILGNQLIKQGSTPTISFKHWKKSNVKVNKTGNLYFKPYTILGLYTITTTLTSCQASPTNVDRIEENSSVTLYFSKITSSYVLPDSVEVTNATYTWDKDTGALALSNPTGDVSITITAVEALPQLATPTNVAVTDTTLTFDEVENATSYDVFVDNVSIGTYTKPSVTITIYGGATGGNVNSEVYFKMLSDTVSETDYDFKIITTDNFGKKMYDKNGNVISSIPLTIPVTLSSDGVTYLSTNNKIAYYEKTGDFVETGSLSLPVANFSFSNGIISFDIVTEDLTSTTGITLFCASVD